MVLPEKDTAKVEHISLQSIINYPQQAQIGKTYLMTIDFCTDMVGEAWPYPEEEYVIHCMVNSAPLFTSQPLTDREQTVVIHRFGSTYGPARFLLTANQKELAGSIDITLVNDWGVPMDILTIDNIEVVKNRPGGCISNQKR